MSTPSTKCPKCGAEEIKRFGTYAEYTCRSDIGGNGPDTFWQSAACKAKEEQLQLSELATLRTSLEKAKSNSAKLKATVSELEAAKLDWETEIAGEVLAGNIVKENFARGKVCGLNTAIIYLSSLTRDEGDL